LGTPEPEKLMARIQVKGDALNMSLPTASELAPLKPFKDIEDKDLTGPGQKVEFCVCKDKSGNVVFTVNRQSFDPNSVRTLKLNDVEEWSVSTDPKSLAPSHPYHIHVNPFQMTRPGPDGKPEIVWKDTVLVRVGNPLKLRTRYETFTGKFVMHCHILDHEDQGMMEVDEVVDSSQ
jgi:FtsP/CotA-like multicopper oxidase with cupredoxin domain